MKLRRRGSKRRKKPRLTIDLIPSSSWGRNCRMSDVLPREVWDSARKKCYMRAGYVCEVCGGKGPKHPVECHERWQFHKGRKIQTLVGFIALCPDCHEATHYGRSYAIGRDFWAKARLRALNGWDTATTEDYISEAFAEYDLRNRIKWIVNVRYAYEYADSEKEMSQIRKWLKGKKS